MQSGANNSIKCVNYHTSRYLYYYIYLCARAEFTQFVVPLELLTSALPN